MSRPRGPGPAADEAARTRALRWGLWGCTTILLAVVALFVVVAAVAYLDLGEPESPLPARLAAAAAAAGEGGTVDLAGLVDGAWDRVHLFPPGASAPAIEACLGFAWENAELVAGHLAAGAPGAFAVVADGTVVDYGWHLTGAGLRLADWPCAVASGDAAFTVAREGDVLVLSRPAAAGGQ